MLWHPLPSIGSPRRGFPDFTGTTGCSDALPPFRPRFLAFAWPYHACAAAFVSWPLHHSRRAATPTRRTGVLRCRFAPSGFLHVEATGTPRFLEDPRAHALFFDPGGTASPGRLRRYGAAFRLNDGVGSRDHKPYGALSHGLRTGCLRFAAGDCSPATQDSLPAAGQLYRAGFRRPLGPYARFSDHLCHLAPPCPGFAWRTITVLGKPWYDRRLACRALAVIRHGRRDACRTRTAIPPKPTRTLRRRAGCGRSGWRIHYIDLGYRPLPCGAVRCTSRWSCLAC